VTPKKPRYYDNDVPSPESCDHSDQYSVAVDEHHHHALYPHDMVNTRTLGGVAAGAGAGVAYTENGQTPNFVSPVPNNKLKSRSTIQNHHMA